MSYRNDPRDPRDFPSRPVPTVSLVEEVRKLFFEPTILLVSLLCVAWVVLSENTGILSLILSDAPILIALIVIGGGLRANAERAKQEQALHAQQRFEYQQQRQYQNRCYDRYAHRSGDVRHPHAQHHVPQQHAPHHLRAPSCSHSIASSVSTKAPKSESSKSTASSSNVSSTTSNASKKKKLTQAEKTEACVRFNHGKCNALASGCKFGHFCMLCGIGHMHAARSEQCPFKEEKKEESTSDSGKSGSSNSNTPSSPTLSTGTQPKRQKSMGESSSAGSSPTPPSSMAPLVPACRY